MLCTGPKFKTMKTLFIKFLSWLGYVPKGNFFDYDIHRKNSELHSAIVYSVKCCAAWYEYKELHNAYEVYLVTRESKAHCYSCPVKAFPFTKETKGYARLCAEELCEMLNQK